MAGGCAKKNPLPAPKADISGIAKSFKEIAAAFGVTLPTVEGWKADGAPIQRNRENDLQAIATWRRDRHNARSGLLIQTSNHYLRSLKRFSRWLVKRERAGKDPLADLRALNVRVDRRHDRRALEPADFYALLDAAAPGPVVEGLAGPDRAMLYLLAGWTGFRRKELASLTRGSFDLESTPPTVTVKAAYAKNKRQDSIPLHPVIVARLQEWFAQRDEEGIDGPLFPLRTPGGCWRKTGKMMRADLEAAGLPYQDEAGLYADFHSNRHTFISNLGRAGVSVTMAQKLAAPLHPRPDGQRLHPPGADGKGRRHIDFARSRGSNGGNCHPQRGFTGHIQATERRQQGAEGDDCRQRPPGRGFRRLSGKR